MKKSLLTKLKKVTSPEQEVQAAKILSEAENTLREIEANRKSLTVPLNETLSTINANAKVQAAPYEETKKQIQSLLSDYRLTPEIQELMAKRNLLERKLRKAELDGNTQAMTDLNGLLTEYKEKVPKSVPADHGMVVRYREKTVLDSVDETKLPADFFIRIPDEKKIKEHIDLVGSVEGVTHHYEATPYCVEV